MQELSINFQPLPGSRRTQNHLTFALPKDCLLDQLTVTGPTKPESDTEGRFNMTTHIDLKSILHQCKVTNRQELSYYNFVPLACFLFFLLFFSFLSTGRHQFLLKFSFFLFLLQSINISGSNVVFGINTNSELNHVAAAADCMVKATTWSYLKIDLVNYLKDVDVSLLKITIHHGDQGTVDVPMVNLTVALQVAAVAAGQHIRSGITNDRVPLDENIMTSEEDELEDRDYTMFCERERERNGFPYRYGRCFSSDSEEEEESEEEIYQDHNANFITATLVIERDVNLR